MCPGAAVRAGPSGPVRAARGVPACLQPCSGTASSSASLGGAVSPCAPVCVSVSRSVHGPREAPGKHLLKKMAVAVCRCSQELWGG